MSCGCGCKVTITNAGVVSASGVEATLLAANPNRKNAFIQNQDTTNAVSVYFTSGAGATAPVVLAAGGSISLGQGGIGVYKGAVYGITSGATVVVGVFEET